MIDASIIDEDDHIIHSIERLKISSNEKMNQSSLVPFNKKVQSTSSAIQSLEKENQSLNFPFFHIHRQDDPILIMMLNSILPNLSINANSIIRDYACESISPLGNLYLQVIKKLALKIESNHELNFYHESFLKKLYNAIISKGKKLLSLGFFRYDLSRLLFKWMIHMRQEIKNDSKFNSIISKKFKPILSLFYKNIDIGGSPLSFVFKSMNVYNLCTFRDLMEYEFVENPHIFHSFSLILDEFYIKKSIVSCEELKNNYFGGNFNGNVLLKFMIIFYDPQEELNRKCFLKEVKYFEFLKISHSIMEKREEIENVITLEYLENLKSNGPKSLLSGGFNNLKYSNSFTIEFLLRSNRRFWIRSLYDFIDLLEKLREEGLLDMKIIERIAGFAINNTNGLLEWNQNRFEDILNEAIRHDNPIRERCINYLKLIQDPQTSLVFG